MAETVGRERESQILNGLYESGCAELIAVYGRLRVGKTFLINQTFQGRFTFVHSGLSPVDEMKGNKSRMKAQLTHFYNSLVLQGMEESAPPRTWLEAFFMLEKLLSSKNDGSRQLVFIDEIQWMDTPRACFMTGFEAFWNGWACYRNNMMVIVCGSSTSWVLDKVLNNRGGLYGRVTRRIHLLPFGLPQCERLLISRHIELSRYETVQAYMALGGIPYYFNYLDPELGLQQNMNALFFDRDAPLKDEFDLLFSSTFARPDIMKSIVRILGTRSRGFTRAELIERTGAPAGGDFSDHLKALIEGGFITEYEGFGENRRPKLYKLIDPFCIFHLRFLDGNGSPNLVGWSDCMGTPAATVWKGLAFENVCFTHIPQIKASLGISGVSTRESLWSKRDEDTGEKTQIDMIIERRDGVVDICEAKYLDDEFEGSKSYHLTLERRKRLVSEHVKKKTTVRNVLITTFGIKKNAYRWDFSAVITLDDLFKDRATLDPVKPGPGPPDGSRRYIGPSLR